MKIRRPETPEEQDAGWVVVDLGVKPPSLTTQLFMFALLVGLLRGIEFYFDGRHQYLLLIAVIVIMSTVGLIVNWRRDQRRE